MNIPAWRNTVTLSSSALPIVILYVTEGCNLQCAMCSYRTARPDELSLEELGILATQLRDLRLRRIVFSGGEPLLRRDLPALCTLFVGVRRTLLTNGLLLARRIGELHASLDDYIVSLDGAAAATHDAIRGAPCHGRVLDGIRAAVTARPRKRITLRCVLQKRNFRETGALIALAHELGVDGISFLAVDVTSAAFGRPAGTVGRELLLSAEETGEFARDLQQIVATSGDDFRSGFIEHSTDRFLSLASHFGAWSGQNAPRRNDCNAPDVSAVITSTGEVLPCFFLPAIGTIRRQPLATILASARAREIRRQVRAYEPEPCHRCTCTLKITPARALLDRF